jgi:hypothetical protein
LAISETKYTLWESINDGRVSWKACVVPHSIVTTVLEMSEKNM